MWPQSKSTGSHEYGLWWGWTTREGGMAISYLGEEEGHGETLLKCLFQRDDERA